MPSSTKPSNSPSLSLAVATPTDAPLLAPLFFHSFHDHPYFRAMMPETHAALSAWETSAQFAINDPNTIVLKVVDHNNDDKVVSFGQWILPKPADAENQHYQPGEEEGRWGDVPKHCDEELANALFGAFAENRREMMRKRRHYCKLKYFVSEAFSLCLLWITLADGDI